jgi:hypothetical protein
MPGHQQPPRAHRSQQSAGTVSLGGAGLGSPSFEALANGSAGREPPTNRSVHTCAVCDARTDSHAQAPSGGRKRRHSAPPEVCEERWPWTCMPVTWSSYWRDPHHGTIAMRVLFVVSRAEQLHIQDRGLWARDIHQQPQHHGRGRLPLLAPRDTRRMHEMKRVWRDGAIGVRK